MKGRDSGFVGSTFEPPPIDPYCEGCIHYTHMAWRFCVYIDDVGHMRPCKAGKLCTVKCTEKQLRAQQRKASGGTMKIRVGNQELLESIQREYVTGKTTMKALAEKYGIKVGTVKAWALTAQETETGGVPKRRGLSCDINISCRFG